MHSHDVETPSTPTSTASAPRTRLHWHKPKRVRVGTLCRERPEPGALLIPCLKLRGMWLCEAGIEPGARMTVEVYEGAVLLRVVEPPVSVELRPVRRRRVRRQPMP
ncbi:hypothetical protein ACIGHF_05220 [Stenotrophomonas sp. NPDC077464]|uniref:hypothetical protein n=1 Tax=unclassified Stenotrophomonas TaxID=196198 RepID=UPI0037D08D3F